MEVRLCTKCGAPLVAVREKLICWNDDCDYE